MLPLRTKNVVTLLVSYYYELQTVEGGNTPGAFGPGMRSTTYSYQWRSVAAMLQKELDSRDMTNPL